MIGTSCPPPPPFPKRGELKPNLELRIIGAARGVSAKFAGGVGCPPRPCRAGKPELTEALWSRATTATGIPEGFRSARPGRVTPKALEREPLGQAHCPY